MTEQHPRYKPRRPGEAHSYLRVAIVFRAPLSIDWIRRSMKSTVDLDGETDYGNIDSFTFEGDRYEIAGDWGHIVVVGTRPIAIEQT